MATRIAAPKMIGNGFELTPMMSKPSVRIASTTAPRNAPKIVPEPPSIAVPPITAPITA